MKQAATDSEAVCTTRQAAEQLGVSLRTAQLWVESGVLRAWKTPGGHRRIAVSSVEELLRSREQELQGNRRLEVLVVEDDPLQRRVYEAGFAQAELPLDLRLAGNGFEGMIQIGARTPDLLVADLRMPGMDGFEMIRELRSMTSTRHMHILVVTGLSEAEIEAQGGLPDDVRVMAKPIPMQKVLDVVRNELDQRARSRLA